MAPKGRWWGGRRPPPGENLGEGGEILLVMLDDGKSGDCGDCGDGGEGNDDGYGVYGGDGCVWW